ncbi:MAG: hypothetical protein R3A51_15470 [Nannocystaceae bacterium]|nr:hypothetical protein [Myxococcales bacterium]
MGQDPASLRRVVAKRSTGLSPLRHLAAIVALGGWIALFMGGTLVDTAPFRGQVDAWIRSLIAPELPGPAGVGASVVVVLLCWTPTNIALLSLVSGVLGTLGRSATLSDDEDSAEIDTINPVTSALIRSLFVYLVVISGVLIIVETPFSMPTQGQYVRLAGLLSLLCFVVSYTPSLFARLLRASADSVQRRVGRNDPGKS